VNLAEDKLHRLPMQIQVDDLFTDESGDWEVITHPARDVTWMAHQRIVVTRSAKLGAGSAPRASRPSSLKGRTKR